MTRPLSTSAPLVAVDEAARAALFGVAGIVSSLPSERDWTFRVDGDSASHVLKVSNTADDASAVEMQTAVSPTSLAKWWKFPVDF